MTALPPATESDGSTRIVRLRSSFGHDLLGTPLTGIRLSWAAESDDADARQLEYQLAVASGDGEWDVQPPIPGEESTGIRDARGFSAREVRRYAVRAAHRHGAGRTGATPLTVEAGVPGDELDARVIDIPSEVAGPVPMLRRVFTLEAAPRSAPPAAERARPGGRLDQRRARLRRPAHPRLDLVPGADAHRHRRRHRPAARGRQRDRGRRRRRLVPRAVRLRRRAPRSTATASGCSPSSR